MPDGTVVGRYTGRLQPQVTVEDGALSLNQARVTTPGGSRAPASRAASPIRAATPRLLPAGMVSTPMLSLLSVAALSHRENAPSNRENAPSNRENAPSNRENAPSNRENAPSNRENAPSNRENAPSNRENAPSNRFAEFLGSLMNDLPSSMKNPPTDFDPVVSFTNGDLKIVQGFKRRKRTARSRNRD